VSSAGGRWTDLDRPPLRVRALTAALTGALEGPESLWREIRVVDRTTSTNADLAAAAREGAPQGLVLVAEEQTAGRGRLGRSWSAPARSGLTFSVLLRPGDAVSERWGWLPLLAGLAVVDAVRLVAEVEARVKWPNDVLVGDRKLAGVLAEVVGSRADPGVGAAVVVGIGLNVTVRRDELPLPSATSLRIEEAATTDRDTVLRAVLRDLARRYAGWQEASTAAAVRADYRAACATIGQAVRVELPGGGALEGTAVGVDDAGRLTVREGAGGLVSVAAGDVVHVRTPA